MRKIATILLFAHSIISSYSIDYQSVDSLSYQFYLNGEWDKLIQLAKQAKIEDIGFKRLSQRVGYAYFIKGKYYSSMKHYEDALNFDSSDEITHLYLYYNGLNTGNIAYARHHASYLAKETRNELNLNSLKLLSSVDLEYNYKITNDALRENPEYKRLGISSILGYKFYLYQTYSVYDQTTDFTNLINQKEYFISSGISLSPRTYLEVAYKNINTSVSNDIETKLYPGNLISMNINNKFNRVDLSFSTSLYNLEYSQTRQYGLHAGIGFSGWIPIYAKSSIFSLNNEGYDIDGNYYYDQGLVFKQSLGALWLKRLWTEAYIHTGNLWNFAEYNGLYLYNNLDPTVFRYGLSTYLYMGKHLTVFSNYTFDKKHLIAYDYYYKQHSISGGIIWKL